MTERLRVGIAGLGTVGLGTYKLLSENAELIRKRCGKSIEVVAVSSRDRSRDRGISLDGLTWYDDARELANDPAVDVVVELIGGSEGVAYELVASALNQGKSVVTANKALIAVHGNELAELAESHNVALLFEAAVAGGIPILKALREGLAANRITRVAGIMNGTCNYILTAMKKEGRQFDDVLAEAQKLGYAETPPDLDVDGIDTAHKLAIITALAYGCPVNFNAIYTEGIRNITPLDMTYAKELGYVIRLLGVTTQTDHGIEQRVHPCLVPKSSPLAGINGVLNAVLAECNALGAALLTGAGAGEGPTASSVVADIMDIAAGRDGKPFMIPVAELEAQPFASIDQHQGEYYVRLRVKDRSGVLAEITSLFRDNKIGVGKILQNDADGEAAHIAITTHDVCETDIQKVLAQLREMEYVLETPRMIRIEEI